MSAPTGFVTTLQLPPQLWVDWSGDRGEPTPGRMESARDYADFRPARGLWTSTWSEVSYSSPYVDEMREIIGWEGVVHRPAWLLTPAPARVWTIEDASARIDFELLVADRGSRPLWTQVARTVDAAHMTEAGARAFMSLPRREEEAIDPDLYQARMIVAQGLTGSRDAHPLDWWYAESTFWTRWCFSDVEHLGEIPAPPLDPQQYERTPR